MLDAAADDDVAGTPARDPGRRDERLSPLDLLIARAGEPETCAFPGAEHRVAAERQTDGLHQLRRLELAHSRAHPAEDALDRLGRVAGSELELRELIDFVDRTQPLARIHEHARGVDDVASSSDERAQRVDDEGWRLEPGSGVLVSAWPVDISTRRRRPRHLSQCRRP